MTDRPFRVSRCAVAPEPLVDGARHDYADTFEVRLDQPDTHTAEQWVRAALEQASPAVRSLIQFVHRRVAGFHLGPDSDAEHILGWRIVASQPDALHIETSGPLLQAAIVVRSWSSTLKTFSTF